MSRSKRHRCASCRRKKVQLREGLCLDCTADRQAQDRMKRIPSLASTVPLATALATVAQMDAAFDRGVNRQVLYASPTALVVSVMDPETGRELNRLTCTGTGWPETPLAAVLREGKGTAT